MVCKNCGADLKPGINYCLECGHYVEEENSQENGDLNGEYNLVGTKRRRKKKKRDTKDMIIYIVLGSVFVVSLLVIIISLIADAGKKTDVTPIPTYVEDKRVTIGDYQIIIPGSLESDLDPDGSTIHISDGYNYTFSYRNTTDNYEKYAKDLSILKKSFESKNLKVNDSQVTTINSVEFVLYEITGSGSKRYFYLTRANSKYTTIGWIDPISTGNWPTALGVIVEINKGMVSSGSSSGGNNNGDVTSNLGNF